MSDTVRGPAWRRRVLVLIALYPLLVICGCDGHVSVKGVVYANDAPDPKGESYAIESGAPKEQRLKPLEGAIVTLYRSPLSAEGKTDSWTSETRTDHDGSFRVSGATAPNRKAFTLEVEKPGYKPVIYKFSSTGELDTLSVVLNRDH